MIGSTVHGPSFEHVFGLSDNIGIFEHADHMTPRREHGYCVDDVARLLIVIAREPKPTRALHDLEGIALRFLSGAQAVDGTVRNRRNASGHWVGRHGVEDCWGRSLWAFGTAAARSQDNAIRQAALAHFERGTEQRCPHVRSMAFAALGAAEILDIDRHNNRACLLLVDAAEMIGPLSSDPLWPWPESRLAYANAAVAEALVAAGHLLRRPALMDDGLELLRWLSARETFEGHYSPTPVGGSGPGDVAPQFDQQPIEAAAMVDACHRAFAVTGDTEWLSRMQMAVAWFAGHNDASTPMFDAESGGGYDGLHSWGPNANQGAESTLALISTQQHGRQLTSSAAGTG